MATSHVEHSKAQRVAKTAMKATAKRERSEVAPAKPAGEKPPDRKIKGPVDYVVERDVPGLHEGKQWLTEAGGWANRKAHAFRTGNKELLKSMQEGLHVANKGRIVEV